MTESKSLRLFEASAALRVGVGIEDVRLAWPAFGGKHQAMSIVRNTSSTRDVTTIECFRPASFPLHMTLRAFHV